jgi:hypothetical protein
MNLLARIALLLMVGGPALGKAQSGEALVPPAQASTPPPLITAPPEPSPEPQEPAPPPSQGETLSLQWKRPRPDYFAARIVTGTLLGGLAGTGGLVGGLYIGLLLVDCNSFGDACSDNEFAAQAAPALLAAGALSSLVVYGMGNVLSGEGGLLPTMLGGFVGTGLGVAVSFAVRDYAALVAIPLLSAVGALIAYEVSDSFWEREQAKARLGSSRLQWTPVVSVTPAGGVLGGLIGRF